MITLAIDYGQRNLGLAVSFDGKVAHQLETLNFSNRRGLIQRLDEIIREQKVKEIVLGMPLNSQGEIGKAGQKVKEFGELLKIRFNLPTFYQNETLSSWQARNQMKKSQITRKKRSSKEHAFSAQIILEDFLFSKMLK